MTTGMMQRITSSGRMTPMDATPTPDLAVPYAAPKLEKMSADAAPMKPKKDAAGGHTVDVMMTEGGGERRGMGRVTVAREEREDKRLVGARKG